MKKHYASTHFGIVFSAMFWWAIQCSAQGTSFTYQGRLNDGANPATGTYDLRFTLYNSLSGGSAVGGAVTNGATSVSNGLFTVTLDFGPGVFTGAERWLEIGVRTNGGSSFFALAPRQPVSSTPYAITAGTVTGPLSSSALSGVFSNAVAFSNAANQFVGTFAGNGAGLTSVNALTLDGLGSSAFWKLQGNNIAPGQFLGSTNDEAVEIRANGARALRVEPNTNGAPNVIGGAAANQVDVGIAGVMIGGGTGNRVAADWSVIAGGFGNLVESNSSFSMIAGGGGNVIRSQNMASTVAGGFSNTNSAPYSFIGGGIQNNVQAGFGYAVLGGGLQNTIGSDLFASVLGGGWMNTVGGRISSIGGGEGNVISNTASHASIVGGTRNIISGGGAFIGGGFQNRAENFDSTVAGGAFNANSSLRGFIGAGENNSNASPHSVIGAGYQNVLEPFTDLSVIGGGLFNFIHSGSDQSVVAGGNANHIFNNSRESFIGGGFANAIQTNAAFSMIGAGTGNVIGTNSLWSTLGGGDVNIIGPNASYATTAGGQGNTNSGPYAFLGGGLRNSVGGFQSTIGGGRLNSISANANWATIGGGDRNVILNSSGVFIGGGNNNVVGSIVTYGTIAGGWSNSIGPNLNQPTIGGGFANTIHTGGDYSFIGGGALNTNYGFVSLIAGGRNNSILPLADHSVISGGRGNRITGSQLEVYATIGGGQGNTVLTNAPYATIPGGFSNAASAYSFAAGNRAKAIHQGSFVWADSTNADFATTASNQFLIRASGGVGINTTNPTTALEVVGTVKAGGFMDNGSGFSGTFAGNGGALTNVHAATLGGVAPSNYWRLGGNFISTFPLSLGTIEQYPMTFIAGNRMALRLEPGVRFQFPLTTLTAPNVLGGSEANVASNGVIGATIAGGGQVMSVIGPGLLFPNVVSDDFGTISGGINNTAGNTNANLTDARGATVGGGENNLAAANYATVNGGLNNTIETTAGNAVIGGGSQNHAVGDHSTIGGGINNQAFERNSTVGGGQNNLATNLHAAVAGGGWNTASGISSFIGGGGGDTFGGPWPNIASGNWSAILGGWKNTASGYSAVVGGGGNNTASGQYAVVPGGDENQATANNTFAAGRFARAIHAGSFVWADSSGGPFSSSDVNQFNVRAAGGVRLDNSTSQFFGNQTRQMINLWGTQYGIGVQSSAAYFRSDQEFMWYRRGSHSDTFADPGAGGTLLMRLGINGELIVTSSVTATSFNPTSDRNAKENFEPINNREVLEKVAALPIMRWNFKQDRTSEHIGPMAQDFHAAFGTGSDDKHIATVDADGVALAAIQGLNEKVEQQRAELRAKDDRLSALEKELAEIKKLLARNGN